MPKPKSVDIVGKLTGPGRPSEYDPAFVAKVEEYIASCQDDAHGNVNLPKREGLAKFFLVTRQTLDNWSKEHPDFFDALERLDAEQKERLIDRSLSSRYNPTIAKLLLSANHGMAEKTESKDTLKAEVTLSSADKLIAEIDSSLKS